MANKRIAKSATEALLILWEEGFFKTWRKQAKIVEVLSKRGNNFTSAELGMALKRTKHLTRRGKKGSYEYIQKYPFVAQKPHKPTSNKKK